MTTDLSVSVTGDAAVRVRTAAERAGLPVAAYVSQVLEAAAGGSPADREVRARAAARTGYQAWDRAGRPEDDGMSMDEVFGR
ncbi:hypothetical protein [Streptomyces sp. NPDC051211]|uniref:hypothetical protein n=1 Tax=Streptomyces sp. NPDC051211 TaxID=3154643 RepID=UPI003450CB06